MALLALFITFCDDNAFLCINQIMVPHVSKIWNYSIIYIMHDIIVLSDLWMLEKLKCLCLVFPMLIDSLFAFNHSLSMLRLLFGLKG